MNSVLYVKYRHEIFGGGLVFAHVITFKILNPSFVSVKVRVKDVRKDASDSIIRNFAPVWIHFS